MLDAMMEASEELADEENRAALAARDRESERVEDEQNKERDEEAKNRKAGSKTGKGKKGKGGKEISTTDGIETTGESTEPEKGGAGHGNKAASKPISKVANTNGPKKKAPVTADSTSIPSQSEGEPHYYEQVDKLSAKQMEGGTNSASGTEMVDEDTPMVDSDDNYSPTDELCPLPPPSKPSKSLKKPTKSRPSSQQPGNQSKPPMRMSPGGDYDTITVQQHAKPARVSVKGLVDGESLPPNLGQKTKDAKEVDPDNEIDEDSDRDHDETPDSDHNDPSYEDSDVHENEEGGTSTTQPNEANPLPAPGSLAPTGSNLNTSDPSTGDVEDGGGTISTVNSSPIEPQGDSRRASRSKTALVPAEEGPIYTEDLDPKRPRHPGYMNTHEEIRVKTIFQSDPDKILRDGRRSSATPRVQTGRKSDLPGGDADASPTPASTNLRESCDVPNKRKADADVDSGRKAKKSKNNEDRALGNLEEATEHQAPMIPGENFDQATSTSSKMDTSSVLNSDNELNGATDPDDHHENEKIAKKKNKRKARRQRRKAEKQHHEKED